MMIYSYNYVTTMSTYNYRNGSNNIYFVLQQIRMHVEKIQEMYRFGQITVNGVAYTLDSVINSVKNVHNTIGNAIDGWFG